MTAERRRAHSRQMSSLFNWRPVVSAPSGVPVVTMHIIRHLGGWSRPIDVAPEVRLLVRDGCWRYADLGSGVGDFRGWWTTPEEYAAAVPDRPWRTAPRSVPGFILCPLVFVRRPQPGDCYQAAVVWSDGNHAPPRWHDVCTHTPGSSMPDAYLDSGPLGALYQPFQWCMPAEFFPLEFFDEEAVHLGRVYQGRLEAWRRLSHAPAPTQPGVTWGDYAGRMRRDQ